MANNLHNIIKELIQNGSYATQQELVTALKNQGLVVKQSTVSRALNRINAIKRADMHGNVAYRLISPVLGYGGIYGQGLVHNIAHNQMVVILNTRTGSADHIAQYIDEQQLSSVMGTIAGDNCIMVIPRDTEKIKVLFQQLTEMFPSAITA